MSIRSFPGGFYAECLPNGTYAVLDLPARVMRTHAGDLPLPDGDWPLYHRITNIGGFQIAGQAQYTAGTWHWINGAWRLDPRLCNGQSAAIFDLQGTLRIIEPAPHQTSQGYRYVAPDGRLVRGDETYGPYLGLSEYTDLGDGILIGQGHATGGILVLIDGVLRMMAPGNCTFNRNHREGERVSSAWVEPTRAVLSWWTLAELRALPRVDDPPPPPPKEPDLVSTPHRFNVVQDIDRQFPQLLQTNTTESCARFRRLVALRLHAEDPGWGELSKRPGETQYQGRAVDAIIYRPTQQVVDIIGGAEDHPRPGRPAWQLVSKREGNDWIAPEPDGPSVDRPTEIKPPPPDFSAILRRLDAQDTQIAQLRGQLANVVRVGDRVGLRADNGRFVCADRDLGEHRPLAANRDGLGSWEEFTVVKP